MAREASLGPESSSYGVLPQAKETRLPPAFCVAVWGDLVDVCSPGKGFERKIAVPRLYML